MLHLLDGAKCFKRRLVSLLGNECAVHRLRSAAQACAAAAAAVQSCPGSAALPRLSHPLFNVVLLQGTCLTHRGRIQRVAEHEVQMVCPCKRYQSKWGAIFGQWWLS